MQDLYLFLFKIFSLILYFDDFLLQIHTFSHKISEIFVYLKKNDYLCRVNK